MEGSQSGRDKHVCLKNAEDQPGNLIDLTREYTMNQYGLTSVLLSQQPCLLTTRTDPYTSVFPIYSQPDTDYIRRFQQKDNTSALKLWLLQHKKNPYPSKPEKIMLAVLAKMTLTQVSTWFANARRRLKKDYPDVAYYGSDTGSHVIYYHKN